MLNLLEEDNSNNNNDIKKVEITSWAKYFIRQNKCLTRDR